MAALAGLDRPRLLVEASLDADDALVEVDVLPAQRLELAAAQAGVQGARPHRPLAGRQGGDQGPRLGGPGNALAPRP